VNTQSISNNHKRYQSPNLYLEIILNSIIKISYQSNLVLVHTVYIESLFIYYEPIWAGWFSYVAKAFCKYHKRELRGRPALAVLSVHNASEINQRPQILAANGVLQIPADFLNKDHKNNKLRKNNQGKNKIS